MPWDITHLHPWEIPWDFLIYHIPLLLTAISELDWSDFEEEYLYDIDMVDKENRPVIHIPIGQWNFRKAAISGKLPRLNLYVMNIYEKASAKLKEAQLQGKKVTRWTILFNIEGFNLVQNVCPLCIGFYTQFGLNYDRYYPNMGDSMVLINLPAAAQFILNIIRPILSPSTRDSMKIFGENQKQWLEYLDKEIDVKQRPHRYGGTRPD